MTQGPPVVLLGNGITALGVLRILGRDGIERIVAEPSDPLMSASRWLRPLPHGVEPQSKQALTDWLATLEVDRAVLMPCSDHHVTEVAGLREDLRARFPASISSASAIAQFVDKAAFASLVRANDIPHPISLFAGTTGDLAQVPDEFFNGAILKPRDSQSFMARFGVKAVRLRSRADAVSQLERIQAAGQLVLLQEYVPGPATEHYFVDGFVDRSGTIRAIFARRRLRMYPLDFGNSTAMVSVPRDDVAPAIESMTALIKAVGYRGIFSAEFKRDYRDNRFKILEVNTRPWWYVEFAARCGVDVCRMAYDDALGRPVETVTSYLTGRRLVFPYYDRFACRALRAERRLSAREWARSWAGAMQPIFELSDPMPGLKSTARMAFRFLTRSGGGRTR